MSTRSLYGEVVTIRTKPINSRKKERNKRKEKRRNSRKTEWERKRAMRARMSVRQREREEEHGIAHRLEVARMQARRSL